MLKLSGCSVIIWLVMFFAVFHSYLNFWAELLKFGDREFYKDWYFMLKRWNARDIAEYWRLWNIPVHHWCKRHIFKPLISKHHFSISTTTIAVFAFSAIIHEILFGIPTHNLTGIAFLGMLFQIPLILLTNYVSKFNLNNKEGYHTMGNLIFWISFTVVGQPACTLLYYHEWSKMSALVS
jgi:diacylglycerol O-acyltransferase 1